MILLALLAFIAQAPIDGVAKVVAEEVSKSGTQSVVVQFIGQAGVIGILMWHLWYTASKVLPKKDEQQVLLIKELTESHAKQVDVMTNRHELRVKDIVDSFKDDLKQEREFRATENQTIKQSIRDSIDRVMNGPWLAHQKSEQ